MCNKTRVSCISHRIASASTYRIMSHRTTQAVRSKLRCRLAEERWFWSRSRERAGEERQGVSRVDTYAAAKEQALEKKKQRYVAVCVQEHCRSTAPRACSCHVVFARGYHVCMRVCSCQRCVLSLTHVRGGTYALRRMVEAVSKIAMVLFSFALAKGSKG